MGRLHIVINDELEKELRALAGKRYGVKKGTLSLAIEEAVRQWIINVKKEEALIEGRRWEKE